MPHSGPLAALSGLAQEGGNQSLDREPIPGANASRAELSVRGSVQSRDQLAAGFELDRGAREVIADRLAATAEMRREESFHDGFEGAAVFGPAAAGGVAGGASAAGVPGCVALARKIDTRWLMMFGLASFAAAMWSFSFITHDWGADQLLIPQVLRGLPQVFAVAPAVNLGLGSLPPERLKYASGLFNMMRNLGGAVGIAVCGAILNNQTNLHFLYIASHLTAANGAMGQLLRTMTERWGTALGGPVAGHAAALSQLWHLAYREASTLAYADAFRAIMIAFVVASLMVPLMRKVAAPAAPSSATH